MMNGGELMLACILSLVLVSFVHKDAEQLPPVRTAVAPSYPKLAAVLNLSGEVVLNVSIDEEGRVTVVKTVTGNPIFRRSAEEAARLWRFASCIGCGERSVKLSFVFTCVVGVEWISAIFHTPFRVEIIHGVKPQVEINVRPSK